MMELRGVDAWTRLVLLLRGMTSKESGPQACGAGVRTEAVGSANRVLRLQPT